MNYSIVFYIIGWILNFEAAFMALPTAVALIYRESEVWCFLATMAVCLMVGMLLVRRKPKNQIFYVAEVPEATFAFMVEEPGPTGSLSGLPFA